MDFKNCYKISVLGGLGRVGLPLSIQLCKAGHQVEIVEIDDEKIKAFQNGKATFEEEGIEDAIYKYRSQMSVTKEKPSNNVVIVSTNNDRVSNVIFGAAEDHESLNSKIWLIRQTLKIGDMKKLNNKIDKCAYIPERLAQGKGLEEIEKMPQIVGIEPNKNYVYDTINKIFNWVETIKVKPVEAELSKLFCNYYRYGTFALANDMYLISEKLGADFNKIRKAIMKDYPRMESFPKAGFSGGYCLPKDTDYLSSYSELSKRVYKLNMTDFVKEVCEKLQSEFNDGNSIGILGLTAKPNNDDLRSSVLTEITPELDLRNVEFEAHDPFVSSAKLDEVLRKDVIFVGTPHEIYKYLDLSCKKKVLDPWGVVKNG